MDVTTRYSKQHLQEHLTAAGSVLGAAEAHGTLCGLLCGDLAPAKLLAHWQSVLEIDSDVVVAEASASSDAGTYTDTDIQAPVADNDVLTDLSTWVPAVQAALQDDAMLFAPLLADDDAPMSQRLLDLAAWCAGLLYGYGLTGVQPNEAEMHEYLRDVGQISQLDSSDVQAGGAEADYSELVEYVRAGMLLLYTDSQLQLQRGHAGEASSAAPSKETLQ